MRCTPALLALLALPACFTAESPVASLSRATLIPGTALGPVELGRTTLNQFIETYGPGRGALLAGDDFCGIEIHFESQQLAFLWEVDAKEAYALTAPPITHAARDIEAFLAAHPQLGTTKLHSISVQAKKDPMSSFYHGGIDGNAKLHASLESVLGYMEYPEPNTPDFVAGASDSTPEMHYSCYQNGLSVYLSPPDPETGTTEPTIQRMTIFTPRMKP